MPALLDKLQKQQQQQQWLLQQQTQQQKQQQLLELQHQQYSQRLHYRYHHQNHRHHHRYQNQHQEKYRYQYQHYQHDFPEQKAERTSQQCKFYNLNINRAASKSSNIIITTTTTTTTSPTSPSPSLPTRTPTTSKLTLLPIPKPIPTPTTSTYFAISTWRQFAAIFTLMLSIICHYSNAQQTSMAATVMLQVPRNFQNLLEGKPQLNSNNTNNITTTYSNNIGHNLTSYSNNERRMNFSSALENHFKAVENHTELFESLSIVDLERNQNIQLQTIDSQPIFDFGISRNITGRTGLSEAVIKCRVDMLNDKSVSWIRKRDLHILTVGTTTYTTDKRFEVSSTKDERDWTLHIKNPQAHDSGIYECQVNTEPKISMAFQLNIIEIPADAKAIITGPPDLHFKVGSAIVLQCLVVQPTVKDIGPIYWYRGEQMITPFQNDDKSDYDMGAADSTFLSPLSTVDRADVAAVDNANSYAENARTMHDLTNDITLDFTARIAMESQLGDTLKSRLRISNAQTTDTGNYTCQPTTASSASVMVHVINDENPAAMQKSCANALTAQTATVSRAVFLCCLTLLLLACRHMNIQKLEKETLDHVMVSLVLLSLMMVIVMVMAMVMLMLIPLLVPVCVLRLCMVMTGIAIIPFLFVGNVAVVDNAAIVIITGVVGVAVAPTLSPATLVPLQLPLSS